MTITTVRPNAVLAVSSAPVVGGGGTTLNAVSDNSDATYITNPNTYHYARFKVSTISLGATQRVRSANLRIRNARDGGSGAMQVTHTQLMNQVDSRAVGGLDMRRAGTTITTYTGPLAFTNPSGASWTGLAQGQGAGKGVSIQVQWLPSINGPQTPKQRVHELYVDYDINNQPVVSGAAASNYTNNATPTITWAFADIDGDVQTRYRVKIFDAATIAAGNFNADTSLAAWDSGEITGGDATIDVGTELQNGVTYTAYIKGAQDWPVAPEGPVWWSAWATTSPFTVTFIPPAAPTITSAGVLADTNQYRALLAALVPVNELAADNASFEGGIGTWVAVTNCTVAVTGSPAAADGVQSMRMLSSGAGDMEARCNLDFIGNPFLDGNDVYTALASLRAMTIARSCQVGLEYLDIAGSTIVTHFGSSAADAVGSWTADGVIKLTETTPANARQARIHVKVLATGGAGEAHLVDKLDVHAGSSTVWTPGGYTNDQGDLLLERGEYLRDDRGPADNWFHPQVASCGTVLRNQGYGFSINTAQSDLNWKWLDKLIPQVGDTPAGMLDWRPSLAVVSQLDFGNWFYGGTAFLVPVVQGQTHIFSVWAWCDAGTFVIQPFIVWRDANGGFIGATGGSTFTLTTTPQRIFVTGTPPGGTTILANGAVQNFASDNSRHVFFTRAGFGLGTIPVDGKRAKGIATGIAATGKPLGLAWVPVRFVQPGLSGLSPGFSFGSTEQIPDYDYPPGRPALYRASITYSSGANMLRSPYSNQVVVYAAPPTQTLLRSVTNPLLQVAVNRPKQTRLAIDADATAFHPLGADGAPVQVRDWVGAEDGDLIAVTSTEAQKARLLELLYSNDVLLIQWAQGGRTYCQVTGRSVDETISSDTDFCDAEGGQLQDHIRYSVHTLSYIETAMP